MRTPNLRSGILALFSCFLVALLPASGTAMTIGGGGGGSPAGTRLYDPAATVFLGRAPGGIAARPGGGFAVALPSEGEVRLFDGTGSLAGRLFVSGTPVSVAVLPGGQLLVGLSETGEVVRMSPTGQKAGFLGTGRAEFGLPSDIAVDASLLRVWVVDGRENRLLGYRWDGRPLAQAGSSGAAPGQFRGPNAIAIHPGTGEIVVSDFGNQRIQVFDREGLFLRVFPVAAGVAEGSIFRPAGVAVDLNGRILVSSAYQGWVQAFDGAGSYLGWAAEYGDAPAKVLNPTDLAVDGSNRLYVVSFGATEVEAFDSLLTGTLQAPSDAVPVERTVRVTFPEGLLDPLSADPAATFRLEGWGLDPTLLRDRQVLLGSDLPSYELREGGAGILDARFHRSVVRARAEQAGGFLLAELTGTTLAGETIRGSVMVVVGEAPAAPVAEEPRSPGGCGGVPGGGAPLLPLLLLGASCAWIRFRKTEA